MRAPDAGTPRTPAHDHRSEMRRKETETAQSTQEPKSKVPCYSACNGCSGRGVDDDKSPLGYAIIGGKLRRGPRWGGSDVQIGDAVRNSFNGERARAFDVGTRSRRGIAGSAEF
jgi:hypothetical protein